MPMMLTTKSFADDAARSTIRVPQSVYSPRLGLKCFTIGWALWECGGISACPVVGLGCLGRR
jgi:hypothetical protein